MSRIRATFLNLAAKKEKALIGYVMAGDPSLAMTPAIVMELEKAGCDMIELGVPFSDPVADGPAIQKASERALANGVTLRSIIQEVSLLRRQTQMPILLMTYLNPVLAFGLELFFKESHEAGVDGLLIPDLPFEEAKPFQALSRRHRLDLIYFIAPTTPLDRMRKIVRAASGFIYYVALTGTTGAPLRETESIEQQMRKIKSLTKVPVAVGFGISTPIEARDASRLADGVIVGSALVKIIEMASEGSPFLPQLALKATSIKEALR